MKRRTIAFTLFALSACVEEEPAPDYRLRCKQFSVALCNYATRCDASFQFGPCLAETEAELECIKVKAISESFDACLDATTRKTCSETVQVDPACVGAFSY